MLWSELGWGVLYAISALAGGLASNPVLLCFSFFILTFAAVEFAIGLFIIYFLQKYFLLNYDLYKNVPINYDFNLINLKKNIFNIFYF